ncbi:peptide deformylase [Buchnera aphidicola]|uniref:peptide deformylase n=1 Tax=Buchnera aphidicola TaxID=9 RepID=UPI0034638EA9
MQHPDIRLRNVAKPVKTVNKKVKVIIDNMFETMYENDGIGLAATQIDIHLQIAIAINSEKKNNPIILINPTILNYSGNIEVEEGCLSIKNKRAIISRYSYVEIRATNWSNKLCFIKAHSLLAVCIQHEIDHLSGKLFIDYLKKK